MDNTNDAIALFSGSILPAAVLAKKKQTKNRKQPNKMSIYFGNLCKKQRLQPAESNNGFPVRDSNPQPSEFNYSNDKLTDALETALENNNTRNNESLFNSHDNSAWQTTTAHSDDGPKNQYISSTSSMNDLNQNFIVSSQIKNTTSFTTSAEIRSQQALSKNEIFKNKCKPQYGSDASLEVEKNANEVVQLDSFSIILNDIVDSASMFENDNQSAAPQMNTDLHTMENLSCLNQNDNFFPMTESQAPQLMAMKSVSSNCMRHSLTAQQGPHIFQTLPFNPVPSSPPMNPAQTRSQGHVEEPLQVQRQLASQNSHSDQSQNFTSAGSKTLLRNRHTLPRSSSKVYSRPSSKTCNLMPVTERNDMALKTSHPQFTTISQKQIPVFSAMSSQVSNNHHQHSKGLINTSLGPSGVVTNKQSQSVMMTKIQNQSGIMSSIQNQSGIMSNIQNQSGVISNKNWSGILTNVQERRSTNLNGQQEIINKTQKVSEINNNVQEHSGRATNVSRLPEINKKLPVAHNLLSSTQRQLEQGAYFQGQVKPRNNSHGQASHLKKHSDTAASSFNMVGQFKPFSSSYQLPRANTSRLSGATPIQSQQNSDMSNYNNMFTTDSDQMTMPQFIQKNTVPMTSMLGQSARVPEYSHPQSFPQQVQSNHSLLVTQNVQQEMSLIGQGLPQVSQQGHPQLQGNAKQQRFKEMFHFLRNPNISMKKIQVLQEIKKRNEQKYQLASTSSFIPTASATNYSYMEQPADRSTSSAASPSVPQDDISPTTAYFPELDLNVASEFVPFLDNTVDFLETPTEEIQNPLFMNASVANLSFYPTVPHNYSPTASSEHTPTAQSTSQSLHTPMTTSPTVENITAGKTSTSQSSPALTFVPDDECDSFYLTTLPSACFHTTEVS